jgi:NSS family neurotransmitter:Na+ symporter
MLLLGVPIMVTEFAIGRHGGKDVSDAFEKMSGGKKGWRWMGLIPVVSGFLVLSYYAVVAGWTLYYAFEALVNGFVGKTAEQFKDDFNTFSSDSLHPVFWTTLIIVLTCGIVALGVQRGIERGAKIMMPLLFVFILVLVGCSLSLPNAHQGLQFLFQPDFSKVDSTVVLSAMGQAFFSLSVGMGCLCTYASYFTDDAKLMKTAGSVALIDTSVAVMSGFIIFPAVFSVADVAPDAGPGLVFITLPTVFQTAFAHAPLIGWLFAVMFYTLLLLAALTSMMSLHEPVTSFLIERFSMKRRTATSVVTFSCIALGTLCAMSFGPLADVRWLFGMTFFDFFDFVSAKVFLPVGGIIIALFTGWKLERKMVLDELTNHGTLRSRLFPVYIFLIKWIAPLAIGLIFLNELGLFAL